MRAFVFLLVAANLVFFAWTQGFLVQNENPDAVRLTQQVAAEKLTVLSKDEPPAAARQEKQDKQSKAEKDKPRPVPEKCLAWSGLTVTDADKLEDVLGSRFAALTRTRHTVPESSSWWVFIPPQANKADADKKAGELKRMGAPEFFVIQDAGPNRWAISLGIFSSESAAEERLEILKGKGVRSAKVGKRAVLRPEQLALEARGPEPTVEAAREALQQVLPEVKSGACGNG